MSRYKVALGEEGEYEPDSSDRVLKNKMSIRSTREIDRVEARLLLEAQRSFLKRITPETKFHSELFLEMHKVWLGRLYNWAGRYRTVEVAKQGFTWPSAILVAENMRKLDQHVLPRLTPCRAATIETVCSAMAEVQAEFLLVHPFREGNGRMARWISDLMALQAGFPQLKYPFRGRRSRGAAARYLHAVQQGYLGDYRPLTAFLVEALTRALRFKT